MLDLGPAGSDANYREEPRAATTMEQALLLANAQIGGGVIYAAVAYDGAGAEDGVLVFWDTNGDGDADQMIALRGLTLADVGAGDIV